MGLQRCSCLNVRCAGESFPEDPWGSFPKGLARALRRPRMTDVVLPSWAALKTSCGVTNTCLLCGELVVVGYYLFIIMAYHGLPWLTCRSFLPPAAVKQGLKQADFRNVATKAWCCSHLDALPLPQRFGRGPETARNRWLRYRENGAMEVAVDVPQNWCLDPVDTITFGK